MKGFEHIMRLFFLLLSVFFSLSQYAFAYRESGYASWYGPGFDGRKTASGEVFHMDDMTAAHKTLPFDTIVDVTDIDTGKTVRVRINDRGPFVKGRIIDLSRGAAKALGIKERGTARVIIESIRTDDIGKKGLGSAYYIRTGSFRVRENAVKEARRLKDEGARLYRADGFYKVILGPYDRRTAEKTMRRLKKQGINGVMLNGADIDG